MSVNQAPLERGNFDRGKAIKSSSKILATIFKEEDASARGYAQKIGISHSLISKAMSGKSLINAKTFCEIMKIKYNLKTVHEVNGYLSNKTDYDLQTYLINELGEEFTNHNYNCGEKAYKLSNSINNEISQLIYSLLYARKRLSYTTIFEICGTFQGNQLIQIFSDNDIIQNHPELELVTFNENAFSTEVNFRKSQMKIIIDSINNTGLSQFTQQFEYDNAVLDEKHYKKLGDEIIRHRKAVRQIIADGEEIDINSRNKVVNWLVAASTFEPLTNKKEVLQ